MKALFSGLLVAASLLTAPVARAQADDEARLLGLLETFLAGASVNDAAVHDRFWSEELIYTSSDGRRFGKQAIMASLASEPEAESGSEGPRYSARDTTVRVFDSTAVVTFRLLAESADETRTYFNTGVFRKRDGAWRAVTWQATVAADDPE